MMTGEQVQVLIGERFGQVQIAPGPALAVSVPVERWAELAQFAKETLGCRFFSFLSAVDWKEQGLEVVAKVDNQEDGISMLLKNRFSTPFFEPKSCTSDRRPQRRSSSALSASSSSS